MTTRARASQATPSGGRAAHLPRAAAAACLLLAAAGGCSQGAPSRAAGNPCSAGSDCLDVCALGDSFPDGYCTSECETDDDCPRGTVCADAAAAYFVCLFPCEGDVHCRDLFDPRWECRDRDTPGGLTQFVCLAGP